MELRTRNHFVNLSIYFTIFRKIPLLLSWRVVVVVSVSTSLHYETKPGHLETSKIHFPKSEGVSEVSERASERVSASKKSSLEQVN